MKGSSAYISVRTLISDSWARYSAIYAFWRLNRFWDNIGDNLLYLRLFGSLYKCLVLCDFFFIKPGRALAAILLMNTSFLFTARLILYSSSLKRSICYCKVSFYPSVLTMLLHFSAFNCYNLNHRLPSQSMKFLPAERLIAVKCILAMIASYFRRFAKVTMRIFTSNSCSLNSWKIGWCMVGLIVLVFSRPRLS